MCELGAFSSGSCGVGSASMMLLTLSRTMDAATTSKELLNGESRPTNSQVLRLDVRVGANRWYCCGHGQENHPTLLRKVPDRTTLVVTATKSKTEMTDDIGT
jgi:hypothetical protein